MLSRSLLITLLLTVGAALAPPAQARTVDYKNIVSPTRQISCFAVRGRSREIECSAPYLPDIGELDTYLGLRPRGRSILAERGDYPGYTVPRRTLHYGDTWRRPGIRCTMRRSGLTCRNRDRHGFHIERDNVRRF